MTAEIVAVPFHSDTVLTVEVDGKPHIILKPAIELLGLDYWTQVEKLRSRSWACTGRCPVQLPGDSQRRDVVTCDIRTFLMLLATVDERRVAENVKPKLVTYQAEVADVIEAHWYRATAPAPREELDELEVAERYVAALKRNRELERVNAELAPAADAWLNLCDADGDYAVSDAAKILDRDPDVSTGQRRLFDLLHDDLEWVYRGGDGAYRAKQRQVDIGRLVEKPQYRWNRDGERVLAAPQVRVTLKGLEFLLKRLKGSAPLAVAPAQIQEITQ